MLDMGLYYPITGFYAENKSRNRQQKEFYSKFIHTSDLVFDIGANVGQRSYVFSGIAKKVVALEPQPFCIRHLKSRFMFTKNVFIEPFAVDAVERIAVLHLSDSHTISSMSDKFINTVGSTVFRNSKWDKKINVKTTTLDLLIAKHGIPSFIKIDVEGFEVNVLKGLSKSVKGISFEFLPMATDEIRLCIDRLYSVDPEYRFNYTLGENLDFILPGAVSYSEFIESILSRIAVEKSFGDIYALRI
ncbi:hypothetical protein BH11BAC1_BH11BAC1_07830 [soil metagenome]